MAPTTTRRQGVMVVGKRYQVFSMKENPSKDGRERTTVWVKAGSAWINRDGSMNVYLDVLPLDGRLHVREYVEKRDGGGDVRTSPANGSPAGMADMANSMGGH
jgi:hypothetical protein